MKCTIFAFGACSALVLSGCYFGNQTIDIPSEASAQNLSAAIRHSSCVVGIRNGPRIEADSGYCVNDSIALWVRGEDTLLIYPLHSVWKISTRDAGSGAMLGFLTGVLEGAAIGTALGLSQRDGFFSTEWAVAVGAAGGGLLGGLLGGTVGVLRGGLTEYLLKENSMPQSDEPSPTN